MAAPMVAGAAALLRSLNRLWVRHNSSAVDILCKGAAGPRKSGCQWRTAGSAGVDQPRCEPSGHHSAAADRRVVCC
ncbi:MAG: hypothetical protein LC114_26465 [Bryobacterales bacterium]|nr:hypothetical protein [Bryobacterales bacterium]